MRLKLFGKLVTLLGKALLTPEERNRIVAVYDVGERYPAEVDATVYSLELMRRVKHAAEKQRGRRA